MIDKKYEKEKAKEMLELIEKHEKINDNREISQKIHNLAQELYFKKQHQISQTMIDISLAVYSFTQAAASGGPTQPLDEFISDLRNVIEG